MPTSFPTEMPTSFPTETPTGEINLLELLVHQILACPFCECDCCTRSDYLAYSSHPLILIHAHILCRLPNNWANHVSDGGSHRWVWLGLSRVRSKTNCHVRFFLCDWRGWLCLDMGLWVYLSLASLHLTLPFPEYYWFTLTSSVFQRHPAECPVHRPVLNPLLTQPRERNFG